MSSPRPHAVCVPYPAQGHMNPMLNLAKLLHTRGFHITFVLTEFNQRRLVRSSGQQALNGLPEFQFETIADGLPFSDEDATQHPPTLCDSTSKNCLPHFRRLLRKLKEENDGNRPPPVSCIVADAIMSFTLDAAQELGIPDVLFWTASACGYLAYNYFRLHLIHHGLNSIKDMVDLNKGSLEIEVDWAPGLTKGMLLKDFPSFCQNVDVNDIMVNFIINFTSRASEASAFVINTFEDLEQPAITTLKTMLPPIYSIGPLSLLTRNKISKDSPIANINMSLWRQDDSCFYWLDSRKPRSVVYVNFGAVVVISNKQLMEFAWGLANSGYNFLWVIRPDMVKGEHSMWPPELAEVIESRGLIVSWCVQEDVLMHPAVGVFLTHGGWNSTIESISCGVPMICWPIFAEQPTNCKYTCMEWDLGMELNNNVKREEVEALIREMMTGEQKGKIIRKKAVQWKEIAVKASGPNEASEVNFERMVKDVLLDGKIIN